MITWRLPQDERTRLWMGFVIRKTSSKESYSITTKMGYQLLDLLKGQEMRSHHGTWEQEGLRRRRDAIRRTLEDWILHSWKVIDSFFLTQSVEEILLRLTSCFTETWKFEAHFPVGRKSAPSQRELPFLSIVQINYELFRENVPRTQEKGDLVSRVSSHPLMWVVVFSREISRGSESISQHLRNNVEHLRKRRHPWKLNPREMNMQKRVNCNSKLQEWEWAWEHLRCWNIRDTCIYSCRWASWGLHSDYWKNVWKPKDSQNKRNSKWVAKSGFVVSRDDPETKLVSGKDCYHGLWSENRDAEQRK